ncbi:MAG: hypothetical protein LRY38_07855 [Aeromonadaceae bacterium]|nr:hypothetical protein [Aeromonadaceae bacterium]
MTQLHSRLRWLSLAGLLLGAFAWAGESDYQSFAARWAQANYQQSGDAKEAALARLSEEVRAASQAAPQDLALKTWAGIIIGSYAGAKGGLGALGLAKEAKAAYEAVIAQEPSTLQGSALTSLGVLYYKVPGWPLGFGDDKLAAKMLTEGLKYNPHGIDSNYFYADFLASQGKQPQALVFLAKALNAPPRPGREVADAGRRQEIQALQQRLQQ